MKKWVVPVSAILLATVVAVAGFLFVGIEKASRSEVADSDTESPMQSETLVELNDSKEKTGDREQEKKEEKKEKDTVKSTLMIYMVGSDLESRSGAGTEDLEEIENSGIDLEKTNVVVLAGGSPRWHNDLATREKNTILHLEKDGFKTVRETESISMGTSGCLSEFLNFAYENYPAEQFALIMWNHGNGPVIGYGKDMLFDNDSLTLGEMSSALAASPFNSGNKLSWVGFDACLMSSAELVCIWDSYAEYLVASQEIEPSFGWDYSVMSGFSKKNTEAFLSGLVDGYMNTCQAYYDKKGYEGRDTTLACIKLSFGSDLEKAINLLFAKAARDIDTNYDVLVRNRVETRALGRASTGSEYDLIDLKDMAGKLEKIYPEEANQLKGVLGKMIVKNGTNAESLCGMSIYYPFYNKYYYEESWGDVYKKLGSFPTYGEYLEKYQNVWLSDDNLESYVAELVPEKLADEQNRGTSVAGTYILKLSPEQNASYADAKFYVLERVKGNLYHPIMTSENVTNENGTLYIDFSGNAIFATNKYGEKHIPVSRENDNVGDIGRYTVTASARNLATDLYKGMDFHLALNRETHELSTSAIIPKNQTDAAGSLTGGKLEEINVEDWDTFTFLKNEYRYITRYPNGVIRPIENWFVRTSAELTIFARKDGFKFTYGPIDSGKYFVMFEITDTRGSKYCSEVLPITTSKTGAVQVEEEFIESSGNVSLAWTSGEEIKLVEKDGVSVFLKKATDRVGERVEPVYKLRFENERDNTVEVHFDEVVFNGNIYKGYASVEEIPSKSVSESFLEIMPDTVAISLGEIAEISKIEGCITIKDKTDTSELLHSYRVELDISEEASLGNLTESYRQSKIEGPYLGALAEKQVIFKNEEISVTLLYFGTNDIYTIYPAYLCIENSGNEGKYFALEGFSVNGLSDSLSLTESYIPQGMKAYGKVDFSRFLEENIEEIENLDILFSISSETGGFSAPEELYNVPVAFKENGTAKAAKLSEKVIFEYDGVRMLLDENGEKYGSPCWKVTVINDRDEDIGIRFSKSRNSLGSELSMYGNQILAHSRMSAEVSYYGERELSVGDSVDFYVHIFDYFEKEVLSSSDKTFSVCVEAPEDKSVLNIEHKSPRTEIISRDGIAVYFKNGKYNTGEDSYAIEVENNTDKAVTVSLSDIVVNGNVALHTSATTVYDVEPNKKEASPVYLSTELALDAIDDVTSLAGTVNVKDKSTYDEIFEPVNVNLTISGEGKIPNLPENYMVSNLRLEETLPYRDALAKEQLLWETEFIRVTLCRFGSDSKNLVSELKVENLGDKELYFDVSSISVNEYSYDLNTSCGISPGIIKYIRLGDPEVKSESIESVSLLLAVWKGSYSSGQPLDSVTRVITLEEKGISKVQAITGEVIYDKNGVQILLKNHLEPDDYYNYPRWGITVINNNDFDIMLNAKDSKAMLPKCVIMAHKQAENILCHSDYLNVDELTFKLEIRDAFFGEVLFFDDEFITVSRAENNQ